MDYIYWMLGYEELIEEEPTPTQKRQRYLCHKQLRDSNMRLKKKRTTRNDKREEIIKKRKKLK